MPSLNVIKAKKDHIPLQLGDWANEDEKKSARLSPDVGSSIMKDFEHMAGEYKKMAPPNPQKVAGTSHEMGWGKPASMQSHGEKMQAVSSAMPKKPLAGGATGPHKVTHGGDVLTSAGAIPPPIPKQVGDKKVASLEAASKASMVEAMKASAVESMKSLEKVASMSGPEKGTLQAASAKAFKVLEKAADDQVKHYGKREGTKDPKGSLSRIKPYKTKGGKVKKPPKGEEAKKEMASEMIAHHMHHLGRHSGGEAQAVAIGLHQAGIERKDKSMKPNQDREVWAPDSVEKSEKLESERRGVISNRYDKAPFKDTASREELRSAGYHANDCGCKKPNFKGRVIGGHQTCHSCGGLINPGPGNANLSYKSLDDLMEISKGVRVQDYDKKVKLDPPPGITPSQKAAHHACAAANHMSGIEAFGDNNDKKSEALTTFHNSEYKRHSKAGQSLPKPKASDFDHVHQHYSKLAGQTGSQTHHHMKEYGKEGAESHSNSGKLKEYKLGNMYIQKSLDDLMEISKAMSARQMPRYPRALHMQDQKDIFRSAMDVPTNRDSKIAKDIQSLRAGYLTPDVLEQVKRDEEERTHREMTKGYELENCGSCGRMFRKSMGDCPSCSISKAAMCKACGHQMVKGKDGQLRCSICG